MKFTQKTVCGALCALLAAFSFACSDDLHLDNPDAPNHQDGLTIRIPNIEAASSFARTRAQNDDDFANIDQTAGEGTVTDLWLIACPSTGGTPTVIDLYAKKTQSLSQTYADYTVTSDELNLGSYSFYVLGNVWQFLPEENKKTTGDSQKTLVFTNEDAVRDLSLNFASFTGKDSNPLEASYLPMACVAEEMKKSDSGSPVGTENSSIEFTNGLTLYADLSFLCAKVRYTILFDNNTTGISKDFGTLGIDFLESTPSISNITDLTPLLSTSTTSTGYVGGNDNRAQVWDLPIYRANYPEDPDTYPKYNTESTQVEENLTPHTTAWGASDRQRAWQGIVYLPENKKDSQTSRINLTKEDAEASGFYNTYFTFKGVIADEANNKEVKTQEYRIPVCPLAATSESNNFKADPMLRSHFYDLKILVKNVETEDVKVQYNQTDWTPKTVFAQLLGQVNLIVEHTKVEAKSGIWTTMGYNSDFEVEFISPEFSEGVPLFSIEQITPGMTDDNEDEYDFNDDWQYHLRLTINPEILYKDLEAKKETLDKLKYFHLKVGNLMKKIEVDPLSIEPILEVNPIKIVIDVKELTASGKNKIDYSIDFITNMALDESPGNYLQLSGTGLELLSGDFASAALMLQDPDNLIDESYNLKEQKGVLNLSVSGILSGNSFWDKPHSYTLTFTLYNSDGTVVTIDDREELIRTVEIEVLPFTTDYVIHFRSTDPNYQWTNPHVYIYQCLEVPSNLKGQNSSYAGKTLGYYYTDADTGKEDNRNNPVAALEYCFSNNVSFSGWLGYGGSVDPNQSPMGEFGGFAMFNNGKPDNQYGWTNPEFKDDDKNTFYNYNINLNVSHERDKNDWVCPICSAYSSAVDYNSGRYESNKNLYTLFAGVSMAIDEDNPGWYKYTLSGLATTGKCLIIFYDGHTWSGSISEAHYRYPTKAGDDGVTGDDTAGLALFDYTDHEGWFAFDGNSLKRDQNFVDDKPAVNHLTALKKTDKIKFIWNHDYNGSNAPRLYVYRTDDKNTSWPGISGTPDGSTYTATIEVKDYSWLNGACTFRCIPNNDDANKGPDTFINLNDYKATYSNGTYTINLTNGSSGGADTSEKVYRFYWPIYLGDAIHLFTTTHTYTDFDTSVGTLDVEKGYYYYDMEYYSGNLTYILNRTSYGNKSTNMTLDDFQQEGSSNIYSAYITSNGGTGIKGSPSLWNQSSRTGIYMRGDNYGWNTENCTSSNEFLKLYEGNGYTVYRLTNVNITTEQSFKVSTNNWGNPNLGSNGSNANINEAYNLSSSNDNVYVNSNLIYGKAYIYLYDNKYTLYLIP